MDKGQVEWHGSITTFTCDSTSNTITLITVVVELVVVVAVRFYNNILPHYQFQEYNIIVTNYKVIGRNHFNLLKPTGHVMHQQFNIQQLYVLPTLYLCVLYLSENKKRLVPLTA